MNILSFIFGTIIVLAVLFTIIICFAIRYGEKDNNKKGGRK